MELWVEVIGDGHSLEERREEGDEFWQWHHHLKLSHGVAGEEALGLSGCWLVSFWGGVPLIGRYGVWRVFE